MGWQIVFVGWPWWLVIPGGIFLAWATVSLLAAETAALPAATRRGLAALRGAAVLAVVALLLEPTLAVTRTHLEKPAVALVVDTSGSMAVADAHMAAWRRLDDAVALGLVPAELRPDAAGRAATFVAGLDADLDRIVAALSPAAAPAAAAAAPAPAAGNDAAVTAPPIDNAGRAIAISIEAASWSKQVAGAGDAAARLQSLSDLLGRTHNVLAGGHIDAALATAIAAWHADAHNLANGLIAAQAAADAALVAATGADSPLAKGLAAVDRLPRAERARQLVNAVLIPALQDHAKVEVLALADQAPPLDTSTTPKPDGITDFAGALGWLARSWPRGDSVDPGAVVLISDGRQTAGGDPLPAARALAARGARVATVAIGDPEPPRDAVVAELRGPAEVFPGETVRLDARYRISGYDGVPWDMVLTCDGTEIERRSVVGSGSWQNARFERPNAVPGVHSWQARLMRGKGAAIVPGAGLLREVWTGIPGTAVADLTGAKSYAGPPAETATLPEAQVIDSRADYGDRLRGWVLPPETGNYTFWVSSDDCSVLRIAADGDPTHAVDVAKVEGATPAGVWDQFPSQATSPIALTANKPCWVEILHKQGGWAGQVGLGWKLPSGALERPIPGGRLAPWHPDNDDMAEASTLNNAADCTVQAVDDPLRVLVVDHQPRWEARYLVELFARDRRVVVDRRWGETGVGGDAGLLPADQSAMDAYDVIILGDLTASEIGPAAQARLGKFVSARGGFLVALSGPRGMPASFGLGALADLLPVRAGPGTTAAANPVTVALPANADSPITTVLDDADLNRRLWPALPPLRWSLAGIISKPGADVLLEAQVPAKTPLAAAQRFGAGRVLWLGSDETWRWRDRLGDRVHQSFWLQAVRWGLGLRLRGKDPRLQVACDRTVVEPGQRIALRALARESDGTAVAAAPNAVLSHVDPGGKAIVDGAMEIGLAPVQDADGLWEASFAPQEEGRYQVEVSSDDPDLSGLSEIREIVVRRHAGVEGIELAADPENLRRIANAGGGRMVDAAGCAALAKELAANLKPLPVNERSTWTLWNGYTVLLVVVGLLLVEWLWRKRVGLP